MDGQLGAAPLPAPLRPVRVWVGDVEAEVTYAGGAPHLVYGTLQVDIKLPDLPPGTYSVVIEIGVVRSQAGVTIVIG